MTKQDCLDRSKRLYDDAVARETRRAEMDARERRNLEILWLEVGMCAAAGLHQMVEVTLDRNLRVRDDWAVEQ